MTFLYAAASGRRDRFFVNTCNTLFIVNDNTQVKRASLQKAASFPHEDMHVFGFDKSVCCMMGGTPNFSVFDKTCQVLLMFGEK